ncbi:MAG: GtrA family protein [Cytophagaceae bacterium]|jgi:putative flippase GtrA
MKTIVRSAFNKEIARFFISGCSAVLIDMAVYFVLKKQIDENLAKGISFLTGTVVAFLMNKLWTFGKREKSLTEVFKFALLYLSTLCLNIAVNHFILSINHSVYWSAFIAATGCSTVSNFLGQKFWVFK